MQLRTRTLAWSAAGLLAVGTATGLSAPALFQSNAGTAGAAAAPAAAASSFPPVPLATAPNYRSAIRQRSSALRPRDPWTPLRVSSI